MHSFMATGVPAGALLKKRSVVKSPNDDLTRGALFLEMAFEAECRIALGEHAGIDGTVRKVARCATLAHGLMFEHMRPPLSVVALETGFIFRKKAGSATCNRVPPMGVVTIGAGQMLRDRMMMRQIECAADIQVTLKTNIRRFFRIDDERDVPARFTMQAPRSVARFAACLERIGTGCHQPGMARGPEILDQPLMTFSASSGSDEGGTRYGRRRHDCPREGAAGNEDNRENRPRKKKAEMAAREPSGPRTTACPRLRVFVSLH